MKLRKILILLMFFIKFKLGRISTDQPPISSLLYASVGQLPHNIKDILFGKPSFQKCYLLIFANYIIFYHFVRQSPTMPCSF